MSGKRLKRREEDVGGERIAKQRPLRQRIRDTTRILSRVREEVRWQHVTCSINSCVEVTYSINYVASTSGDCAFDTGESADLPPAGPG